MLWFGSPFLVFAQEDGGTKRRINIAYCSEKENRSTLEEAKECVYVPLSSMSLPARHAAVRWVRIEVQLEHDDRDVIIRVIPHLIREIEIFDGRTGKRLAGPVGTSYPYSAEHGLLAGYQFTISTAEVWIDTLYVRMVTDGLPYAHIDAAVGSAIAQGIQQELGLGIHLGFLMLLATISVAAFAITRNKTMGVFALNILNLLLGTLAGSGFLYKHVWPEWPVLNSIVFNSTLFLRPGFWVLLAASFLEPYQPPIWYRKSCRVVYVMVGGMLLLSWFGQDSISNGLLLVVGVTAAPVLQVIAIYKTQRIRLFYKQAMMLAYTLGAAAIWFGLGVTLYPTENPRLPVLISRIIDYVNPAVLLGLVIFHYWETAQQLTLAKNENVKIRLGLDYEKKLQEERRLMVDMLTHELKNPLASISLAAGSLAAALQNSDGVVLRRLENIDQSVRSMDLVIERCNLMNQLDQSALVCRVEKVNLSALLANIITKFPDDSQISISLKGTNQVSTDPEFFEIIVSNLIDNGLKYSPVGSNVQVNVEAALKDQNRRLVVEVVNQIGEQGSPDKNLIFSRFYRNQLAQKTSGSGVGLYLVQALANLMGGSVAYRQISDQVTLRVDLPLANDHV